MTNDEQLTLLRLQKENIELKGLVLGSQLQALNERIAVISQARFDASVDAHDMPSGATTQVDKFSGD